MVVLVWGFKDVAWVRNERTMDRPQSKDK